jgi:hypothetical protein
MARRTGTKFLTFSMQSINDHWRTMCAERVDGRQNAAKCSKVSHDSLAVDEVDLNGPGLAAPHSALRLPKQNKFIPAIGLQWVSIKRPALPRPPTLIRLELYCLHISQRRN